MTPLITFILFLYGTPLHNHTDHVVAYVAEFDTQSGCDTVKEVLENFPPRSAGDPPQFKCLESISSTKLLDSEPKE